MARFKRTRTLDPVTHEPIVVEEQRLIGERPIDPTLPPMEEGYRPSTSVTRVTPATPLEEMSPVPPADMAEYPPPETVVVREPVARPVLPTGTWSLWAILGGSLATVGLLSIAGVVAELLARNTSISSPLPASPNLAISIGLGGAFIIAGVALLASYWGGYAAARMARAAGWLHGLLTAIVAAGILVGLWALTRAANATPFVIPFNDGRFQIDHNTFASIGVAMDIVIGAAMLVGGMAGGMVGRHWHTRRDRMALGEEL